MIEFSFDDTHLDIEYHEYHLMKASFNNRLRYNSLTTVYAMTIYKPNLQRIVCA